MHNPEDKSKCVYDTSRCFNFDSSKMILYAPPNWSKRRAQGVLLILLYMAQTQHLVQHLFLSTLNGKSTLNIQNTFKP